MDMYETPHPLRDYLATPLSCSCGHTHYAPLRDVAIAWNALEQLPRILRDLGKSHPYLICDAVTRQIAGERCLQILQGAEIQASLRQLTHTGFDEATLGELVIHMPPGCDIAVAVGTGAINDMTRYFSFKLGIPFMTVATAAPMDGFASSIAAIQVDNLKTTFDAQTPLAIIGDTEILKGAPYSMIAAGLGDLLGKATCLCDWKLAHQITGEHICLRTVELMEHCVQEILEIAPRAKDRDPAVLGRIMEGLVLSGVAMSLYGNSRPASGCEHHMSHYWETIFGQRGQRPAPHGTQVGVGTVLILKAAEILLSRPVDFDAARAAALRYDPTAWESAMETAYGPAAPGIIELEHTAHKNDTAGRLARLDAMEQNWPTIEALLRTLPASSYVEELLRSLGAPASPSEIGVDDALLRDTFLYCKEIRPRYTILQMLWDLNLLEETADACIRSLSPASAPAARPRP